MHSESDCWMLVVLAELDQNIYSFGVFFHTAPSRSLEGVILTFHQLDAKMLLVVLLISYYMVAQYL
jgi:hypothetical protein